MRQENQRDLSCQVFVGKKTKYVLPVDVLVSITFFFKIELQQMKGTVEGTALYIVCRYFLVIPVCSLIGY